MIDLQAIAKDASERVHKNGGCVPQLAYAPILFALQDALSAAPKAGEGEADGLGFDLYDEKCQLAMSWTMRQVAGALQVKDWTGGDGSESVEGDVSAEIWSILENAGLVDDDGLRLPAQPPAADAGVVIVGKFWRLKAGMHGDPEPGHWHFSASYAASADTAHWYEVVDAAALTGERVA